MRRILILVLICLLFAPNRANALFQKKDYKQNFLNNAINADRRNDEASAFHSYEKALFYYKKDKKILESYAQFCERHKYFDKAEILYQRLYVLTKDKKYLFKSNLCTIKNGKISSTELNKIMANKDLTQARKNELHEALIYHFSYKEDWANVKKTCAQIPKNVINRDVITTCIVASEKTKDEKSALGYYLQFSELYPKDSQIANKIISSAEKFNNYPLQEKFIKKLLSLNPNDNGIKYKLAGLYEKHGDWNKAAKIYEGLMIIGDKSEHVKNSLAYDLSQLNPKKPKISPTIVQYIPKPLSGYKLSEKLFYESWKEKKYDKAQEYLAQMLKIQPQNPKLLQHRVDILMTIGDYKATIGAVEDLQKVKPLSINDEKLLAFLYSKTDNYPKSIEIIESLLQKNPRDKELLNLALEYSMASKNWDKSIAYTDKLLILEPNSEKLLKSGGDLYSMNKDFPNALKYYKKLAQKYPKLAYKKELANLYMANQEFEMAQEVLEHIYNDNPNDSEIVDALLNSLLAQQKTYDAYALIRKHNLLQTKEGYMVLGDLNMNNKKYSEAGSNYFRAFLLAPKDVIIQNKLADSYRMMGHITGAAQFYNRVLSEDPSNLEAKLGLGSVEIDRKNYTKARQIFYSILKDNPDYRPAKIAIAHSFIANNDKLDALEILDKLPEDNETKLMKAQVYYDMNMWSNSKEILKGSATKASEDLKYKIRRDEAVTITPAYSFFFQNLADEFQLNYHKFGVQMSKSIEGNKNVFMEYNVIVYTSGNINGGGRLNNVVNEFRTGIQARPTEKTAYRLDIGVKAFEFGGGMINTDSWIQHYFNDNFNLKLGFKRNNIEQSYLSAVGENVSGIFTGQAADNKIYVDYEAKLPHQFYSFGRGSFGIINAQNLITNNYIEAMVGFGKLLYNNPRNKWVNIVGLDLISYNSGYQYNLLKIYGTGGQLYGGYFSPNYFSANTANVKVEGYIKKWHMKYGVKAFGGIQNAVTPDQTTPTWGYSPYIAYDINDNICINAVYNHFTYADLVRDQFMINAVIRGFKKHAKN